jgi:hypothetical protein
MAVCFIAILVSFIVIILFCLPDNRNKKTMADLMLQNREELIGTRGYNYIEDIIFLNCSIENHLRPIIKTGY